MYNFIFYFIYRSQLNQKDGGPQTGRVVASIILYILLVIEFFIIYGLVRYYLFKVHDIYIPSTTAGMSYQHKFLVAICIFLPSLWLILKYYTKARTAVLAEKYDPIEKYYTFSRVASFFLIVALHFAVVIWIASHIVPHPDA